MTAPDTQLPFAGVHGYGCLPPHCRRSALNVGLSAEDRPDSEPLRMRTSDPNRTFAPTTSVSGILVTGRVLLYALVDEFAAISQDAFIGLPGVTG
jgi:hypothetical protein